MADFIWADILILVLYFVIVLAVGLFATCRARTTDAQGYFLAGQASNWFLIGTSTWATNIGAPMLIGIAGTAAASGIAVIMYEWQAMLWILALGWFFLPVYRACGCYTMPDYMKLRFGGRRIQILLAVLMTVVSVVMVLASQMYAGAVFIEQIFNWSLYPSVCLILAISAVYTVMGGLTAVMWTDCLQTIILLAGSIVLAVISMREGGGWSGIQEKYPNAASNLTLSDVTTYGNRTCGLPRDDWDHIFRSADADIPWTGFLFGLPVLAIFYWCNDQLMVQRALSAKSLSDAKGGMILASYLKITAFPFFVLPGMVSRMLFPEEIACSDPDVCWKICQNPSGCSNIAYPLLVVRILPTGLKGLMLSALLAALMSSLTSSYNSTSTLFTMDIYRNVRQRASSRELMVVGRTFTLLMVGISIVWLPILQRVMGAQLWEYFQACASYTFPPAVAAFTCGIFWTRTTEPGAFYGLVVGLLINLIRACVDWSKQAPPCGDPSPDERFTIVTKLHFMHFAALSFLITCIVIIGVSLVTKPRTREELRRVTFWTKDDPLPTLPELEELQNHHYEDNQETKENTKGEEFELPETTPTIRNRILRLLCGIDRSTQEKETTNTVQSGFDISEKPKIRKILDANAVLCILVCAFIHGYWG